MTPWPFVIAAYAIVSVATLALIAFSLLSMRRAEAKVDAMKEQR
jgi:hypothetical protein